MSIRRIEGRWHEVGGVRVKRLLPVQGFQGVGPFVYLDHFGPLELAGSAGIAVPPHPHIGLAAVTYLFGGEMLHRDSLGNAQVIRPGEVNWMTAGRGVVHSERSRPPRGDRSGLHGIQTWVALPAEEEDCDPAFSHYARSSLPSWADDGVSLTLVAGQAYGERSPVHTPSLLCYLEVSMEGGAELVPPGEFGQIGVYLVSGAAEMGEVSLRPRTLAVVRSGVPGPRLRAKENSHLMLLGGEPQGRRYLWWNFVASSRDRIEQAKADWRQRRFPRVPGDAGRMTMPGEE